MALTEHQKNDTTHWIQTGSKNPVKWYLLSIYCGQGSELGPLGNHIGFAHQGLAQGRPGLYLLSQVN